VLKIQRETHNSYVFCLVLFTFDLLISKCTFNIVTIYLQWSITGTKTKAYKLPCFSIHIHTWSGWNNFMELTKQSNTKIQEYWLAHELFTCIYYKYDTLD